APVEGQGERAAGDGAAEGDQLRFTQARVVVGGVVQQQRGGRRTRLADGAAAQAGHLTGDDQVVQRGAVVDRDRAGGGEQVHLAADGRVRAGVVSEFPAEVQRARAAGGQAAAGHRHAGGREGAGPGQVDVAVHDADGADEFGAAVAGGAGGDRGRGAG